MVFMESSATFLVLRSKVFPFVFFPKLRRRPEAPHDGLASALYYSAVAEANAQKKVAQERAGFLRCVLADAGIVPVHVGADRDLERARSLVQVRAGGS